MRGNLLDEILSQIAADAAVGQLDQLLLPLNQLGVLDNSFVNVDFGHVIHQNSASEKVFFFSKV